MPIQLSRREISVLLAFAARSGNLTSFEAAINALSVSPANAAGSANLDPRYDQSAANTIQTTLSAYVENVIQSIQNSTSSIAESTYTPSLGASAQMEAGGVHFSASGGIVASVNFSTGDYVLPNLYGSFSAGASTAAIPSASASVGASMGIGDISGFGGTSSVISAGPIITSYNDTFKSAGLQYSVGVSGGIMTQTSETYLQGELQRGNIFSDMQSIENTLWNMSQDPLTGTFR